MQHLRLQRIFSLLLAQRSAGLKLLLVLALTMLALPARASGQQASAAADTAAAAPGAACAQERPNVVLILSDDQRWDDFSFMGHPVIHTPYIDQLAGESATFVNGYVPASLCRPSLAKIITGQYPHQHGITSNDPPEGVHRAQMLRFICSAGSTRGGSRNAPGDERSRRRRLVLKPAPSHLSPNP